MAQSITRPSAASTRDAQGIEHIIPAWVIWVQRNFLLSALIIAEAYLLGTFMTQGWVPGLEQPLSWGVYGSIGVGIFFVAGACIASLTLFCGAKSAVSFQNGRYAMGVFNFIGLLFFATCEIWASLAERSAYLHPQPSDIAVLSALSIHNPAISVTAVVVSILLPVASVYYGFSQQPQRLKTADEQAAEAEAEEARIAKETRIRLAKTAANAQVRAAQVQGMGMTAQAAKGAALGVLGRQSTVEESATDQWPVAGSAPDASLPNPTPDSDPDGPDDNGPSRGRRLRAATIGANGYGAVARPTTPLGAANSVSIPPSPPLWQRVPTAGVVTTTDLVAALSISPSQARTILNEVPTKTIMGQLLQAPVDDTLAFLQARGSAAYTLHAQNLRAALTPPKVSGKDARSGRRAQSIAQQATSGLRMMPAMDRAATHHSVVGSERGRSLAEVAVE